MEDSLEQYISDCLKRNLSVEDIKISLLQAGWSKEQIEKAFQSREVARYVDVSAHELFHYVLLIFKKGWLSFIGITFIGFVITFIVGLGLASFFSALNLKIAIGDPVKISIYFFLSLIQKEYVKLINMNTWLSLLNFFLFILINETVMFFILLKIQSVNIFETRLNIFTRERVFRELPMYLFLSVVFWILFILGLFLFVIPGIAVAVFLSYYKFSFVIEGVSGLDAFKRSYKVIVSGLNGKRLVMIIVGNLLSKIPFIGLVLCMIYFYIFYLFLAKQVPLSSKHLQRS